MSSPDLSKPKTLVVGHQAAERDQVALALARRGFPTTVASTFELRFAAALEQPDFVLLDAGSLGAEEVMRLLQDDASGFPSIVYSRRPIPELGPLVEGHHIAAYVRRTGTVDELVDEVEGLLNRLDRAPPEPSPDPGAVARVSVPRRAHVGSTPPDRVTLTPERIPASPERPKSSPPDRAEIEATPSERPKRPPSVPPVLPGHPAGASERPKVGSSPPVVVDYVAVARRLTRSEFVEACPFPFLVGRANLVARPKRPRTAAVLDPEIMRASVEQAVDAAPKGAVTVLAIRTTHPTQSWITVGRARDADIVIQHATLSNVHAHFLPAERGLTLADAGSRNGTWVGGRLLEPHGAPSPVIESGDVVRFGELEFTFLSPNVAWDTLRVNVK